MASMTRAQMRGRTMSFAGVTQVADTFAIDDYLKTIADEVADETKCLYASYNTDIVSGTASYTASLLLKIRFASALDANGNVIPLALTTPSEYDSWSVTRRVTAQSGTPSFYITQGLSTILLSPVPNYSVSNGITVEGLGVPGDTWAADSATCPLPERIHLSVCQGAAAMLADSLKDYQTADRQRRQYEDARNRLWKQVIGLHGSTLEMGSSRSPSSGYTFYPVV